MSYFRTNLLGMVNDWNIFWTVIGSISAFIWNVKPFIGLLLCLVLFDLITGTLAARHKKNKITSRGLFRTVEKLLAEFIAILAAEGIRVTLVEQIPVTYIIVFVIAMAEFKSIVENIEVILDIEIWTYIQKRIFGRK